MTKRALISVFDKTGLIPLAKGLAQLGYEIISIDINVFNCLDISNIRL